jgi:hypothetical protein
MNYLHIKYKYGQLKEYGSVGTIRISKNVDDIREITSYKFSDNIEELELKSDPGSSPYATWIDNCDNYIKFSLYVNIEEFNEIFIVSRGLCWIDNMIKQCRRSENLKKLID